jgi:long-subunit fatty acid transport protein
MGVISCIRPGRLTIIGLTLSVIWVIAAHAQQTEFSSTLNPVGSGARATAMGGAFIGIADDATAASWNPAGLIQLEKPEVSAVYSYFHRKQEYSSEAHPEMNSVQNMDSQGLNYASFVFPFNIMKKNIVASINYQRLYEMNKEYRFPFHVTFSDPSVRILHQSGHQDFMQEGFLYTLSPALAVEVTPEFSIGATFNLWDNVFGRNGWKVRSEEVQESTWERDLPLPLGKTLVIQSDVKMIRKEENSFHGENWHFGFLWSPFSSWTIGGVYKTPFEADFEKKVTIMSELCFDSAFAGSPITLNCVEGIESDRQDFVLKMPASYGVGVAYRYSDTLTFALDVYRTEWSRFVLQDSEENEKNPLTGADVKDGRLKDTTQVRMGMEYLIIRPKDVIPLRLGFFYDPEPATGHLDEYYGFSAGTGYAIGNVSFDISYQYRMGRDITTDFLTVSDSDPDIDQHTVTTSVIYYF